MKPGTSMNRPTSHRPRGGTPMASWTPPQGLAGSLCPKGGPQGDTAGGAGQRGAPGKSHFALPGLAAGSCSLVTPGPTSTRGAAAAGSSGHEGQRERRGQGARRPAGGQALRGSPRRTLSTCGRRRRRGPATTSGRHWAPLIVPVPRRSTSCPSAPEARLMAVPPNTRPLAGLDHAQRQRNFSPMTPDTH